MAGSIIAGTVVFAAPLLVGSVHRPLVLVVPLVAGLGAACLLLAELVRRRIVRVSPAVLLPLSILLIPAIQSIPLPAGLLRKIDPAADALLADSPVADARFRPLSLDPPETRAIIGKAGASLAVFLIAFHLASGRQQRRLLLVRVVAASTVAAMAIGLGHRILGETQIYGHFLQSRGLLNGPFINANHTAEFLELGAFVCVAAALSGASALNRIGWLAAALMAGACALGSLSRGAVLSLGVGTLVFIWLRHTALSDAASDAHDPAARPRRTMLWVSLMVVLLSLLTFGLGADQVLTRVRETQISSEMRLKIWKDSLRVLAAHPFGIGRGAFDRVFPIYRTAAGTVDVRFSFIECEPLQYLVEMGWIGFVIVAGTLVGVIREWASARRRDQIEAALVAAVTAVLVHNLVDFGLETLGVALPFAAILGTIVGRTRDVAARAPSPRLSAGVWGVALVAVLIGGVSVAHASADDFDQLLEKAPLTTPKRQMALRAQAAHPGDYFYVLVQAATEPIAPDASGRSPRLHVLNHALRLCPNCPAVHTAVAGTLWALGRRAQAVMEWHAAVEARPVVFDSVLNGAMTAGARPDEIAVIAGGDPERLVEAASFQVSRGRPAAARSLLALATDAGAPAPQVLLIKAGLDIAAGATDEALKSLNVARRLAPQDPRVAYLLGEANLRAGRVDQALQELDAGIGMNPQDLSLLRSRLAIIMSQRKWFLANGALTALEVALNEARLPTTEVHLAAARYYATLRDYPKAGSEYDLALTLDPGNAAAWVELAVLWEGAGKMAMALEAYRQANTVSPGNKDVLAAIDRLTARIRTIRSSAESIP